MVQGQSPAILGSIQEMQMVSANVGLAIVATKSGPSLFRTTSGAAHWSPSPPSPKSQDEGILGMTFLGHNRWIVASQSGPVVSSTPKPGVVHFFYSDDNGQRWRPLATVLTPKSNPFVQDALFDMVTPKIGYVMIQPDHGMGSEPGILYRTTDAGRHWAIMSDNLYQGPGQKPSLPYGGGIRFVTPSDGWLMAQSCTTCPGHLYWTSSEGRTWTKVRLNVPRPYSKDGITLLSAPFSSGTPGLYYMDAFANPKQGQASTLLFRLGPGSKFARFVGKIPSDMGGFSLGGSRPSNIDFVTGKIGYKIATTHGFVASGLFVTTDGGTRWHRLAAKGLPSIQNANSNLQSIDFLSQRFGWIVWTKSSGNASEDVIYRTTDGGESFREIAVTRPASS